MSSKLHAMALACAVIAMVRAEAAPGIWRCGNSYSDQPCAEGKAIETQEPPSAERRRQADEATRRDMTAARQMERERLALEAAQPRRRAVLIGAPPPEAAQPAEPGKKKRGSKLKTSDAFVASYAGADAGEKQKKKKKAPAD